MNNFSLYYTVYIQIDLQDNSLISIVSINLFPSYIYCIKCSIRNIQTVLYNVTNSFVFLLSQRIYILHFPMKHSILTVSVTFQNVLEFVLKMCGTEILKMKSGV